ncbi:MAG: glycerol kinase GlpK [Pseudomonadota bacterium]
MSAASPLFIALDEGTTSTRAAAFDLTGNIVASHAKDFKQLFPQPGWVEHDAEEIFAAVCSTLAATLRDVAQRHVAAIGITNQRETIVIWSKKTGEALAPAIVWQDRRTADRCAQLVRDGLEPAVQHTTGLLLDPYFTASKLAWLLENTPGARALAEAGGLCAGTIDAFLAYRLTGAHITDHSNASRTLLYNIEVGTWDDGLCDLFAIPRSILPEIVDCYGRFAHIQDGLPGAGRPLCGMAGDQQAASIGQMCFAPGSAKATYGTGCFLLVNTGDKIMRSKSRLLSTVLLSENGKRTYALEGSIFVAGSLVQWLRDELQLISDAAETEALARSVADSAGVVIVPALTGLGAPYWQAQARGAIFGLTRGAGRAHIARAALEAQSYQTHDLMTAMAGDGQAVGRLRVDGGMVANDWLCQDLSDILCVAIDRPKVTETTALGAAVLAAVGSGHLGSLQEAQQMWQTGAAFEPSLAADAREDRLANWAAAVARIVHDPAG